MTYFKKYCMPKIFRTTTLYTKSKSHCYGSQIRGKKNRNNTKIWIEEAFEWWRWLRIWRPMPNLLIFSSLATLILLNVGMDKYVKYSLQLNNTVLVADVVAGCVSKPYPTLLLNVIAVATLATNIRAAPFSFSTQILLYVWSYFCGWSAFYAFEKGKEKHSHLLLKLY